MVSRDTMAMIAEADQDTFYAKLFRGESKVTSLFSRTHSQDSHVQQV